MDNNINAWVDNAVLVYDSSNNTLFPTVIPTRHQQLDSVQFDSQSNTLTIYLQNGGFKSVNLSSLNNQGKVFVDNNNKNVGVVTDITSTITTGQFNTAVGTPTMLNITEGTGNSAFGDASLINNNIGDANSAFGRWSLGNNSSGSGNTAVGEDALKTNTTGDNNTAIGKNADVTLNNLSNATAIGANAEVSQSNSLVLGNNVNVGIGTTAPTEMLNVRSNSTGQDAIIKVEAQSSSSESRIEFSKWSNQYGSGVGFTPEMLT